MGRPVLILDFIFQRQIILGMLAAACLFVPWSQRRRWFFLRVVLGTALLFAAIHFIPTDYMPSWAQLLSYTGFLILLLWRCFDYSIIHAVFSATCAYAVQHITSKFSYMVAMPLIIRGTFDGWMVLVILLLTNVLVCVPIFWGFTRRFLRDEQFIFDSRKTVLTSGLFLFVAVYLSSVLEDNFDIWAETYLTSYWALNAFCILFAVAILSMEFSNCGMKRLENEKRVLEQLLESDKLRYEQAKRDMEKINIRYHDLKQQYSRADDEERAKLEAEMRALDLCYYTDNKALDIVLTQKAALCENNEIQFVCSVDGRCLSGMKHYHIYSLLGNAIDNAIECLTKVEDRTRRVIDLNISRYSGMAVIRIENYTPAQPVLQDGVLVTTKRDASGHGYGMKSIKNIAELYGGTADYFVEDQVFCLLVTFPYTAPQTEPSDEAPQTE